MIFKSYRCVCWFNEIILARTLIEGLLRIKLKNIICIHIESCSIFPSYNAYKCRSIQPKMAPMRKISRINMQKKILLLLEIATRTLITFWQTVHTFHVFLSCFLVKIITIMIKMKDGVFVPLYKEPVWKWCYF